MSHESTQSRIVLVVDDRPNMILLIQKVLKNDAHVLGATGGREAIRVLEREAVSVVIADLRMPDVDGLSVLRECKRLRPRAEFVLMTAYASLDTAVEALRLGAYDYLTKPIDPELARAVVLRALERATSTARDPEPEPVLARSTELAGMPWTRALESATGEVARQYLEEVLRRHGGRVAEAAAHAGVERESFYRLMRRYGVQLPERGDPSRGGGQEPPAE